MTSDPPGLDDPDAPEGREARRARLREAARRAELSTGVREETEAATRRHIVVRVGVIALGSLLTLAGLGMLVLPGPGLIVVIAGLGVLSTEVAWAERLLAYAKRRARVDQVTAQAPWIKPVSAAVTVAAVVISILYVVRWR